MKEFLVKRTTLTSVTSVQTGKILFNHSHESSEVVEAGSAKIAEAVVLRQMRDEQRKGK